MAKVGEVRDLPDEELFERLEQFKEELFNLRFQLATGQLDNPMRVKEVRHDIARILTVLRHRHLETDLEERIARADADSLERSREDQASGKKKGDSLKDMIDTSVPESAEEPGEQALEKLEEPAE